MKLYLETDLTLAEKYYFLAGAAMLYDCMRHVPAGYIFETALATNKSRVKKVNAYARKKQARKTR